MTLRAITFVLSDLETGRGFAHALIVPEARYASIAWLGVDQLDRRRVTGADWQLLDMAIREKLPPTPLESSHIVSRILLPENRRRAVVVQYVVQLPLEISSPDQLASRADEILQSFK